MPPPLTRPHCLFNPHATPHFKIHAPFAGIAEYDPTARSSTLEQGSHNLPPTTNAPSYRSTHTLAFATNAELEGQVIPAAVGAHAAAVMIAQMGKVRDADQRRRRMGGWGTWWSPSLEMGKLGNNDDPSQHTVHTKQVWTGVGRCTTLWENMMWYSCAHRSPVKAAAVPAPSQ
jgi:hypothetical protein